MYAKNSMNGSGSGYGQRPNDIILSLGNNDVKETIDRMFLPKKDGSIGDKITGDELTLLNAGYGIPKRDGSGGGVGANRLRNPDCAQGYDGSVVYGSGYGVPKRDGSGGGVGANRLRNPDCAQEDRNPGTYKGGNGYKTPPNRNDRGRGRGNRPGIGKGNRNNRSGGRNRK